MTKGNIRLVLCLQFLIIALAHPSVFAEMEAYGNGGSYLGIFQGYEDSSVKIYSDDDQIEASYIIGGDGAFTYFGPNEASNATTYFTTTDCSGAAYVKKNHPYARLFTEYCAAGVDPVESTQYGNFFITVSVSSSKTLRSKVTYNQGADCGVCSTMSPNETTDDLYVIEEVDIETINEDNDFVYPVETPIRLRHKPVTLDSESTQIVDNLTVNTLTVNDMLTSAGTNNTFGSLTTGGATISAGATITGGATINGDATINGNATISDDLTVAYAKITDLEVISSLESLENNNNFGKITTYNFKVTSAADIKTLTVTTDFVSNDTNSEFNGNIAVQDIISDGDVSADTLIFDNTILRSNGVGYFNEISSDKVTVGP